MFARLVAVLLLVLGVSALVALPGGAVSSPPTSAKVRVGDNFFKETKVTIVAGGKVTWVW
jgi:plastocyanin